MKPLLLLATAVLCLSAQAQAPPDTPPPVIVHVFSSNGTPSFEFEGALGSNGPILRAGGTLVVRTSHGLSALIVVEPSIYGELGTVGQNAAMAHPGAPGALQAPPHPKEPAGPTYHRVSVLACTDVIPADYEDGVPACGAWQALRPPGSPDGPLGFELEVNHGLQDYALPPAVPDPPVPDPDDPNH
ncbi:hypothetical protein [Rubrivirga sp. IMCC43871]|uniref:hypothetical protein n=1 Tax=Rubrivirga sp. IMCC43871 TaxID=3391575 RepID=UPI00398F9F3D